jgi:peptidoglycan pentaglycine glycine transferase (the first glycine)
MALSIRIVEDKTQWESFVLSTPTYTFLQAWNWGEFNRALGDKVFRLGLFEEGELAGVALILKVHARRGSFLFCPHGPLIKWENPTHLDALLNHVKDLARQEGVAFIRISPLILEGAESRRLFHKHGFRDAPIHMHAEATWMLDIRPSEEELLAGMRKNTRYYVRRAARDGVEVFQSRDPADVAVFNALYQETVDRHSFVPYSEEYLEKQFGAFAADDQVAVFLARYGGEVLSGAIIMFYGRAAFYHHGASSSRHPKIPSSYLLQWEAVRAARRRGCTLYNFWGIASTEDPQHPWAGLTFFKQGFGGFRVDYLHAQDLPLSPLYWFTYGVEAIRRRRRRL